MTENMIAPDNQEPPQDVLRAAERCAAFATQVATGRRRALHDLAADRAGELVVPPRRRNIDLSTPAGRIRFGYLGGEARNALAELFEALDEVDTADWPLGLVALREGARQALRLSATVDDEPQYTQCPNCSALGDALGGRVTGIEPVRGQL